MALVNASHRLIAYGALAPGRANHHQVATLDGRWFPGVVRGDLVNAGWGDEYGYPALVLRPDGNRVDVQVFESTDLPDHWERLDEFEGPGYQRVITAVETALGSIDASIYVLNQPSARGVRRA